MKKSSIIVLVSIFVCFCILACSSNTTTSDSDPKNEQQDSTQGNPEVKRDSSPFLELGCCEDASKRETEKCCCQLVYDAYKDMRARKDTAVPRLASTDKILGYCRNKMPLEFDALENPPSTPESSGEPSTKKTGEYDYDF